MLYGIAAFGYLIFMPFVLFAFFKIQKHLSDNYHAKHKTRPKDLPKPLKPMVKERLKFSRKDNRPGPLKLENRIAAIVIWVLGFGVILASVFFNIWWLGFIALFINFLSFGYRMITSKKIVDARNNVYKKMALIGSNFLGYDSDVVQNPTSEISILSWRDFVRPEEVIFQIPPTFGASREDAFLQQFNQIFGSVTAFVPKYDAENQIFGWDYENGKLTLKAVPPLPQKAPWSSHYVDNPAVAWSFFPIALGVSEGLELPNPETGETEYVLGFDVSGEQEKLAKQYGIKMSEKIVTAPMTLVAGGTGGGKALPIDLKCYVFSQDELMEYSK